MDVLNSTGVEVRIGLPNINNFTNAQISDKKGGGYENYALLSRVWGRVDPVLEKGKNKLLLSDATVSTFKAYGLVSNYWVQP